MAGQGLHSDAERLQMIGVDGEIAINGWWTCK